MVIVLGAHGLLVKATILKLPAAHRAQLCFVDLGATYASGFGRSLLAACPLLARPNEDFLLCTPDHIFDSSLVHEMRTSTRTPEFDAVALVEENARSVTGQLPATAVHVHTEAAVAAAGHWPSQRVSDIGTRLPSRGKGGAAGIEAGLYRCSSMFFTVLADLSCSQEYVTVADAMKTMAATGRLGATMTAGRRWLALETQNQVETTIGATVGRDGEARFPWQVRTVPASHVRRPPPSGIEEIEDAAEEASRRLVLPIPGDAEAVSIRPTPSNTQMDFLLVGSSSAGGEAASSRLDGRLDAPLLEATPPTDTINLSVDALPVNSAMGALTADMSALSIELMPAASMLSVDGGYRDLPAYLIQLPPAGPTDRLQSLLALPAPLQELERPLVCATPLPLLPSAIDRVTLAPAVGAGTVALTVHKRVPTVGWVLLATALVTCYSGAPVTNLQRVWLPAAGGSAVFLHSAWRGLVSCVVCSTVACLYPMSRVDLRSALTFRLGRRTTRMLMFAGVAFFINFGAFNVALEHTSISHASLFSSCSSIYLVTGQLLGATLGRGGCVPMAQVFGVAVGAIGAYLTTRDAIAESGFGTPVSPVGDLVALTSGIGCAIYLSIAEAVRPDLDPLAFFSIIMAEFALLCLAAATVMDSEAPSLTQPLDAERGVLGWLLPIPARLPVQLWLAVVVDLVGNLGFIAVLKFVPAITVAAAMLLGPFVATIEGIAIGVDQLPGPWTISGGALISLGSLLISTATSKSSTSVDIHFSHR